jgi:glycosyltransferase involved in cell wall biosynthesis
VRVCALLEDPVGASARLRFEPFARRMEAMGHEVVRTRIPPSGPARWRLLASQRDFDATLLQRRLLQPWESVFLRARARRLVVDVDDAIWRRDHAPHESAWRRVRARALLRRADSVLAGSRTLGSELRGLGVEAVVLPTTLDESSGRRPSVRNRARAATLAWIGQASTWRYAGMMVEAWERARRLDPGCRFVVVGSGRSADPRLPGACFVPWSEETERSVLEGADLGLAPLPDDPWTRGKCAARVLSFLAAGVPVVASAVGAQREIAEEIGGVELAIDPADLAGKTARLLADRGRREVLASGLAQRAAERRSTDRWFPPFMAAVSGRSATSGERPSVAACRDGG